MTLIFFLCRLVHFRLNLIYLGSNLLNNFSLIELSELVIRTTERHYLKNLYKEEILFSQLKLCFLFAENIY